MDRAPGVMTGRRADAVRAVAEVRDVEVALEDLLLRVLLLQGEGVARFLHLPAERVGVRRGQRLGVAVLLRALDQHVLDVLLGQRAAALAHRAGRTVVYQGPQ